MGCSPFPPAINSPLEKGFRDVSPFSPATKSPLERGFRGVLLFSPATKSPLERGFRGVLLFSPATKSPLERGFRGVLLFPPATKSPLERGFRGVLPFPWEYAYYAFFSNSSIYSSILLTTIFGFPSTSSSVNRRIFSPILAIYSSFNLSFCFTTSSS